MKKIAILSLIMLTGCAAAVKLPGTRDAHTEQIQALVKAIEKQSDAMVAIVTKASPTPEATPSPSPASKPTPDPDADYGQEPLTVIASARRIR